MANWNVSNVDQLIDVLINKKLQGMSLSSSFFFPELLSGLVVVWLYMFAREEDSAQQFLLSICAPDDLLLLPSPLLACDCAAEF